jgi:hypothetical protein
VSVQRRAFLQRREVVVLLTLGVLALVWLVMPAILQPQEYHGFADQRTFLGVPNAFDVLSNLAFIVAGAYGLWQLRHEVRGVTPAARLSLIVFFTGLTATGFGSGYYHLAPDDARLFWDRLPMTVAFAGVFGEVFGERVSRRSGIAILLLMLVIGPFSAIYWRQTGDLSLYALVQFGGIAGILVALAATARGEDPLPWGWLIGWYIVAKIAESADAWVWQATGELFAGHMVKHLAAAAGGFAIARALRLRVATVKPGALAGSRTAA